MNPNPHPGATRARPRLGREWLAAFALLFFGCSERTSPRLPMEQVRRGVAPPAPVEPLRAIEQRTAGAAADATLPLLITLHGRGGTPETFQRFFADLDVPLRIVHLEAPIDEGDGRAWWSFRGKSREEVRDIVRGLADRTVASLHAAERTYPSRGEPLVLGFSQGAMIVYALALDHPQTFGRGYVISGVLFESLVSGDLRRVTPLRVLHGEDDPIIGVNSGARSAQRLISAGANVQLQTFPGVPHWIMGAMKEALHEDLRAYVRTNGGNGLDQAQQAP